MKTIKIEDNTHKILKEYCNIHGLKIVKFISNIIIEKINDLQKNPPKF